MIEDEEVKLSRRKEHLEIKTELSMIITAHWVQDHISDEKLLHHVSKYPKITFGKRTQMFA